MGEGMSGGGGLEGEGGRGEGECHSQLCLLS
jgi:hypothetical protein